MTKGKPRTEEEFVSKRLEIAHLAAGLFFDQGFNRTSVSQIAQAAGIGKSTLYDYFASKDEIILLLLEEPLAEVRQRAEELAAGEGSVLERISAILHMHLDVLLRDRAFIFKLGFEYQKLPFDVQARHEIKRRAYQDLLSALIQEGIQAGSFRSIDADIVVKTLLSVLSSVIMTPRPTNTPARMLDEALDLVFNGVNHT